jgi:hypothetical protein
MKTTDANSVMMASNVQVCFCHTDADARDRSHVDANDAAGVAESSAAF